MTKQVVYIISIVLLLSVMADGCRKKLADLYYDPDQTVQPSIEKFFTEMLNNDRVRPSYWNIRTFVAIHTGIYTQSLGYLNTTTAYQQNAGYTQDRWNDFYQPGPAANGGNGGIMAHYRLIESLYESLKDDQQKLNADVFFMAAKVVLYDQASQMVDLWGDIPFSQAGTVNTSGNIVYAAFDNASDIYDVMLDGLKNAALYFSSTQQLSTAVHASFSKQDILLNGQFDKWQRYANSIRLRLLMRLSFVNEEKAKAEALKMINNPGLYPLIDGASGYVPATTDILLQPLTNYVDDLHLALSEVFNYSAPDYMLNTVMKPANDPRIPVLFDKYGRTNGDQFIPNTDYNGLPITFNAEQQQVNLGRYAILDSATFLFNNKLPGIVITAPEVNFLKAEAWERWGGGDAQGAYETAIRQSIAFYYYLNNISSTIHTQTQPAAAAIDSFLQNDQMKYTGTVNQKLAKIWIQKWLHFGFLQSVQGWAEYRRTKYPVLQFYPSTLPGYELPPSRLVYPSSETSYNTNYASVKDRDVRTGRVFWDVK